MWGLRIMSEIGRTQPGAVERLVLVADDDPIFRSLVSSQLAQLSCGVVEAGDGGSAWREARRHTFDLAIVDFEMPGLDGIALVQCLRGHPKTRHLPIVMCTSRTDGAAMREALGAGITSFLTKPVNWSLFDSHISHLFHIGDAADSSMRRIAMLEAVIAGLHDIVAAQATDEAKLAAIRQALEEADVSVDADRAGHVVRATTA